MLKEGYDHFEATRLEPKVAVCEKRYVFDAAEPDGATKPLSFNPKGACPVYQLDKNIADAVLDYRRDEQYKMAKYMAEGVSTVAFRTGIDGGMNPVFASKMPTQEGYDAKGNLVQVAVAPGSLPREGGVPATTVTVPKAPPESAPVQVASTPAPESNQPVVQAQKPTSIGGLIGNMFGGETKTANADESAPVLRGTNTDMAAKPKRAATYQTASSPHAKPHEAAKPKAVANAEPQPAAKPAEKDTAPEVRTAYTAPAPAANGMLTGAQPVMPTGTFAGRWSGAAGFR
jgi:hypothetical protein